MPYLLAVFVVGSNKHMVASLKHTIFLIFCLPVASRVAEIIWSQMSFKMKFKSTAGGDSVCPVLRHLKLERRLLCEGTSVKQRFETTAANQFVLKKSSYFHVVSLFSWHCPGGTDLKYSCARTAFWIVLSEGAFRS